MLSFKKKGSMKTATRNRLIRTKGDIRSRDSQEQWIRSGATAVLGIVSNSTEGERKLTVAWVGDSRAVLCRAGVGVPLTEDHKALREDEKQRIREAGGSVDRKGRLFGDLAVSRAFGDLSHKGRDPKDIIRGGQMKPESDLLSAKQESPLIATPEIASIQIEDGVDTFVILATDGVWDTVSNQEAVQVVQNALNRHGDPERAAFKLVEFAMTSGSVDNTSVCVLCFN